MPATTRAERPDSMILNRATMDIDRSLITLQVGESVSVIERGMAGKIDTTIVEEETDTEKQFTCTKVHTCRYTHIHRGF